MATAPSIATTSTGMPYVGNPDFRGYLAAEQQTNPSAVPYDALNWVGNDYAGGTAISGPGTTAPTGVNTPAFLQYIQGNDTGTGRPMTDQQAQQNALNQLGALYKSYSGYQPSGSGSGSTSTTGTGGLYPNINIPAYNAAVQQKFNTDLTAAQQEYQSAQNVEPSQMLDAQNVAATGIKQAQQNAANQEGIANQNITNTNAERTLALQQLADQLHGQYQGLMNQLGSVGAGNSSAALMGSNALGHEGQISTANANMNADTSNALQGANIQSDKSDLATYVASEQAQLKQTLDNIQNQFTSQLQELAKSIGDSTAEARQSLAYFGGVLSHAATLASQQAQAQFMNSITPAMAQQQAQDTAAQQSLEQNTGNVAQWVANNPNLAADIMNSNGAQMQLAPAVTPIAINTPTISPFAPASTGNVAAGQNTPSAFSAQNSQTAQPNGDVISYLNSLLSSAPGQPTSNANGG